MVDSSALGALPAYPVQCIKSFHSKQWRYMFLCSSNNCLMLVDIKSIDSKLLNSTVDLLIDMNNSVNFKECYHIILVSVKLLIAKYQCIIISFKIIKGMSMIIICHKYIVLWMLFDSKPFKLHNIENV